MENEISTINLPDILAKKDVTEQLEDLKKSFIFDRAEIREQELKTLYQNYDYIFAEKTYRLAGLYRNYEKRLGSIKQNAWSSIMGGINYAMNLNEMKLAIKKKFENMKERGLIITKDEFEEIECNYYKRPLTDLTRIWGADYLKQKLVNIIFSLNMMSPVI